MMSTTARSPRYNRLWLERGFRTRFPVRGSHLPRRDCRAANSHGPHIEAGHYCRGHRFDRT